MSTDAERIKSTVEELATRFRGEMIPLTNKFSYFLTMPMADEDLRQYLNDPIAAISPAIIATLPQMSILLAPFLEKGNGKEADSVTFERPPEPRYIPCSRRELGGDAPRCLAGVGLYGRPLADGAGGRPRRHRSRHADAGLQGCCSGCLDFLRSGNSFVTRRLLAQAHVFHRGTSASFRDTGPYSTGFSAS